MVYSMNWTEKEKLLFKDLKTSERTSIEKYGDFEGRACDPELKQLFGRIRQQEEEHLQTLEQMEGRVKRDVWYIENWTFFLDLKIIVVTVLNMFKGEKNAY